MQWSDESSESDREDRASESEGSDGELLARWRAMDTVAAWADRLAAQDGKAASSSDESEDDGLVRARPAARRSVA